MTAKVVLVQEAERQLLQIDEWWILNRRSAPNLFLDELSKALELIAEMPKIGQRSSEKPISRESEGSCSGVPTTGSTPRSREGDGLRPGDLKHLSGDPIQPSAN